jgi:hypothetical protein
MFKGRLVVGLGLVAFLALARAPEAGAATIFYDATYTGVSNIWQYEYVVERIGGFSADEGFAITFDKTLFKSLVVGAHSSDWDVLVQQPDLNLPSNGLYDALALKNAASLASSFFVTFQWLGALNTVPGQQPFYVYKLNAAGQPIPSTQPGDTGLTTKKAAVPEPSVLALLAAASAFAARYSRRRPSRA